MVGSGLCAAHLRLLGAVPVHFVRTMKEGGGGGANENVPLQLRSVAALLRHQTIPLWSLRIVPFNARCQYR